MDDKIHKIASKIAIWMGDGFKDEKIQYGIELIISELLKIIIVLVLMILLGKVEDFILMFIMLTVTRSYMGGIHAKTFNGCLILSLLFFVGGSFIYPFLNPSILLCNLLLFMYLIFVIIEAPIQSDNRLKLTKQQSIKRKLLCLGITVITIILVLFYKAEHIGMLLFVLYFQMIGAIIILKRRCRI